MVRWFGHSLSLMVISPVIEPEWWPLSQMDDHTEWPSHESSKKWLTKGSKWRMPQAVIETRQSWWWLRGWLRSRLWFVCYGWFVGYGRHDLGAHGMQNATVTVIFNQGKWRCFLNFCWWWVLVCSGRVQVEQITWISTCCIDTLTEWKHGGFGVNRVETLAAWWLPPQTRLTCWIPTEHFLGNLQLETQNLKSGHPIICNLLVYWFDWCFQLCQVAKFRAFYAAWCMDRNWGDLPLVE